LEHYRFFELDRETDLMALHLAIGYKYDRLFKVCMNHVDYLNAKSRLGNTVMHLLAC